MPWVCIFILEMLLDICFQFQRKDQWKENKKLMKDFKVDFVHSQVGYGCRGDTTTSSYTSTFINTPFNLQAVKLEALLRSRLQDSLTASCPGSGTPSSPADS